MTTRGGATAQSCFNNFDREFLESNHVRLCEIVLYTLVKGWICHPTAKLSILNFDRTSRFATVDQFFPDVIFGIVIADLPSVWRVEQPASLKGQRRDRRFGLSPSRMQPLRIW
jgi:hypothetical protein